MIFTKFFRRKKEKEVDFLNPDEKLKKQLETIKALDVGLVELDQKIAEAVTSKGCFVCVTKLYKDEDEIDRLDHYVYRKSFKEEDIVQSLDEYKKLSRPELSSNNNNDDNEKDIQKA